MAKRVLDSLRLPRLTGLTGNLRQLEQDLETVINVLKPGPLGTIEHRFSATEINEAKAIVERAVANWRRSTALGKDCHR